MVEDDSILVQGVGREVDADQLLLAIEALQGAPSVEARDVRAGYLHGVVGAKEGEGGALTVELELVAVAQEDVGEGLLAIVLHEEGLTVDAEAIEGA